MTFIDDLKSGKCAIYGQFSALLSVVFLILFGFYNLFNLFSPVLLLFAILSWVFAFITFLIEVPFCASCCANESLQRVSAFFQANQFKAILYLVFAIVLWTSLQVATTTFVVSALFLTFTSFFYGVAAFRKEDPAKSSVNSMGTAARATATYGGQL